MERTSPADFSHGRHNYFFEGPAPKKPQESSVKRVLYGTWDTMKRGVESQSPKAWQRRIVEGIRDHVLPRLSEGQQEQMVANWEKVELAAKYAGIGITGAEIAGLIGSIYLGKRYFDERRRARHMAEARKIRIKPLKRRNRPLSIPVAAEAMHVPDPRDMATLKEFSESLDRLSPERRLSYRTKGGAIRVLEKRQSRWKQKATAAMGEVLQQMPDVPDEYIDTKNPLFNRLVRTMWYEPSGPMRIYRMRLDEPAVRERIAESMIRGWARERGITDQTVIRKLGVLWGHTNLAGIPRNEPHEMAQFIDRHVKPQFLSDYARTMLTSAPVKEVPTLVNRISHIMHLRDSGPLDEAKFAPPVQHALQRISALFQREDGKDMRQFLQMERAIEGIWLHREDAVIVQNVERFGNARSGAEERRAVSALLDRLAQFTYEGVDRWALWNDNKPAKEVPQLLQFMKSKGFPGLRDLAQALSTS